MSTSNFLKRMEYKKKKRGENWHPEDKDLLQELVRERVAIIEDKNTDTNTNFQKVKAWRAIAETFNAIALSKRNVTQLRCQWSIIKMNAKKNARSVCNNPTLIIGDEAPPGNQNSVENILSWLPKHSESNDGMVLKTEKPSNSAANSMSLEEPAMSDAGINYAACVDATLDDVDFKDERKNTMKKKFKKRKANFSTVYDEIEHTAASANETDFENMCRAELHRAQIENEHRKARNLDLEHKILLEQLKFYKKKNEMNF